MVNITRLFFPDEFVTTVVNNALDANQVLACNAVVPHQFLGMHRTEVAPFEHLLLLHCVVECDEVLGQVLRFEVLLQCRAADGTASELLLLDLKEAFFAKGVAAVQVARDAPVSIEVLDARGTLHLFILN